MAHLLEIPLKPLLGDWTSVGAHTVAVALAFGVITGLYIIFGELMPKSVALQRTEQSALLASVPLRVFLTIFRPLILLFNGTANRLLGLVGLHPAATEQSVLQVDELHHLLEQSRKAGILDSHEAEIAGRALEFNELRAHEVMVPGIVHIRDVAHSLLAKARPAHRVIQIMRPVLAIPEYLPLNRVLATMRQQRTQMALLVVQHGGYHHRRRFSPGAPQRMGHIPQVGDQSSFQGYTVRVEAMDGLGVAQIRLLKAPVASQESSENPQ